MKLSRLTYLVGGISVLAVCLLWVSEFCAWLGASTPAKVSLSSTVASSSLALAGIILVLLGFALGIRDQVSSVFAHTYYNRILFVFFLLVPLSLVSSYAATVFTLSELEPFFIVSISALFLAGIILVLGATMLVGGQLKR